MPSFALLLPTWLDLAGWAGVALASLAMCGIGRLVTGAARPESALLAGWGVCVLVLTGWGIATPVSMRIPALVLLFIGLGALLWPRARLARPIGASRAHHRAGAAAARDHGQRAAGLPDTWLNLVPNAAYLTITTSSPPIRGRRRIPHRRRALQHAARELLSGRLLPNFPASAMIDFNLVLQLAAGRCSRAS